MSGKQQAKPPRRAARRVARPTRQARVRVGEQEAAAPRRCPSCGGDLRTLPVVMAADVACLEIVARSALDHRQITSTEVAQALGVGANRAGAILRRAWKRGLLARISQPLPTGSWRYTYAPDSRAVAYVRSDALARELRERLFAPAASATSSLSPRQRASA